MKSIKILTSLLKLFQWTVLILTSLKNAVLISYLVSLLRKNSKIYQMTKALKDFLNQSKKKYESASEIAKEIMQIMNKARNKQMKYNNMTISEILVLSSDIMNCICSDQNSET